MREHLRMNLLGWVPYGWLVCESFRGGMVYSSICITYYVLLLQLVLLLVLIELLLLLQLLLLL